MSWKNRFEKPHLRMVKLEEDGSEGSGKNSSEGFVTEEVFSITNMEGHNLVRLSGTNLSIVPCSVYLFDSRTADESEGGGATSSPESSSGSEANEEPEDEGGSKPYVVFHMVSSDEWSYAVTIEDGFLISLYRGPKTQK